MKSYILTIMFLFSISSVSYAEDSQKTENKAERTEVRRGNKEYNSNNYVGSEINYRKALDANSSSQTATYNLGNSLYKQGKYSDAIKEYEKAVVSESDEKKLSEIWHNLGNSYFMEKNLAKSIDAYKNCLRINPKDEDARYNLRMAQLMLQQQQQEQQQDNKQEQQKEQQNKDQKQQQQEQQQKDQQNKEQKQQQQTNMSQENAQQILDAMQQDERNTQEKVRKAMMEQRKKRRTDKEW
ncbi:MAG: tetratricopeptide repeat protein [Muribaculaceae bacterium]|nr:tetratricopeptide repeat protein [Muribaculaceae bacterium]